MRCQKCGCKTGVSDVVRVTDEVYRKRVCKSCGHKFFTIEFEAEQDQRFYETWHANYRKHKGAGQNEEN